MREPAKRAVKAVYTSIPFKQPMFSVLRHVPVPTPIMRHLRFEGIITVRVDAAHSFRMHNFATFIENDLFWRGYGNGWEATSLKLWRQLVPEARTILDIGANTGVYSLAASCLNPEATVIAFEPGENVFGDLEANISLNGYQLRAERLAASDRSGAATIFELPGNTYNSSLKSSHHADQEGVLGRDVAVVRIDEYLRASGISGVDLVKIDVEQHEARVLAGFGSFLSDNTPTIMVEVLTEAVAAGISALVVGLGYQIYRIVEQVGIRRMEDVRASEGGRNLLFCQPAIFRSAELARLLVRG